MIIFDFGSGETCRNDKKIIHKMIDELKGVMGSRKDYCIKWQLFIQAKDNEKELLPLMPHMFEEAFNYAKEKDIVTTASVFDLESNIYLSKFQIPFVKLSCNPAIIHMMLPHMNRGISVFYSVSGMLFYEQRLKWHIWDQDIVFACIPKYPATIEDYENSFKIPLRNEQGNIIGFDERVLRTAISDHTPDFELFKKYMPMYYECHFKLDDSIGADNGAWARTPAQIEELFKEYK